MTAPAPQSQPNTAHTPTPWRVGDRAPYVEIWGGMRMNASPILASMEHEPREANAAFIVEAVNNHATLLNNVEVMKRHMTGASDEIAALRAKVDELTVRELMILAHLYKDAPLKVANLCDDVLDQSGGLLGRVRDSARASLVNSQDRGTEA